MKWICSVCERIHDTPDSLDRCDCRYGTLLQCTCCGRRATVMAWGSALKQIRCQCGHKTRRVTDEELKVAELVRKKRIENFGGQERYDLFYEQDYQI